LKLDSRFRGNDKGILKMDLQKAFDFTGQVAVITGGGGVLCGTIAKYFAARGGKAAIVDLNLDAAQAIADDIKTNGGTAEAFKANVLERDSVEQMAKNVVKTFGKIDILINGAGGNKKEATTSEELPFADMPIEAVKFVMDLNFIGTLLPSQVIAPYMFKQNSGKILNFSSMASLKPLTKTPAYSAAKAAITNFTQWLAVHISQGYSDKIRVNALVPGFFLTAQNKYLLTDKDTGNMTPRGQQVIDHTPMARYGSPEDLVAPALFLLSDASSFVHGTTLTVDGGMSAYGGV